MQGIGNKAICKLLLGNAFRRIRRSQCSREKYVISMHVFGINITSQCTNPIRIAFVTDSPQLVRIDYRQHSSSSCKAAYHDTFKSAGANRATLTRYNIPNMVGILYTDTLGIATDKASHIAIAINVPFSIDRAYQNIGFICRTDNGTHRIVSRRDFAIDKTIGNGHLLLP